MRWEYIPIFILPGRGLGVILQVKKSELGEFGVRRAELTHCNILIFQGVRSLQHGVRSY